MANPSPLIGTPARAMVARTPRERRTRSPSSPPCAAELSRPRNVTSEHIANARRYGATDLEIHDTVLIAAAFCMYNRYVDGLATLTPTDEKLCDAMSARMANQGYISPANAPRDEVNREPDVPVSR